MKIAHKYIRQLGAFLLVTLLMVSCTEFEEYSSTTFGPGPTISLSAVAAMDSSITVSVTSNAAGYASVALYAGTGNAVPEDPEDLATGNIVSMDFQSKKVAANQAVNFTFRSGIVQDATYEFMAVANNADGKVSDVATLTVTTADTHAPMLVETDPESSYSSLLEAGAPITLYFDEAVVYDNTKEFTFTTLYLGMSEPAASVEVSGNAVAVYSPDIPEGEYVMLSWPEGAIKDASGNAAAGMESYYDADNGVIIGVYIRRVRPPREAVSVAPEADSIASGGDIVITFDNTVKADGNISQDMIILEYYNEEGVFTSSMAVDPGDLVFDGMTVTVPQSYAAAAGWWVDLTVDEAAFDIGLYVPSAEVTGSWRIY